MNPETTLYLESAIDEVMLHGKFVFDDQNVNYLIDAFRAMNWHDVTKMLPEAQTMYTGRLSIPCMVIVASRAGRKPRVTVCRRQWNNYRCRWEWSRGLKVTHWREVPEV